MPLPEAAGLASQAGHLTAPPVQVRAAAPQPEQRLALPARALEPPLARPAVLIQERERRLLREWPADPVRNPVRAASRGRHPPATCRAGSPRVVPCARTHPR